MKPTERNQAPERHIGKTGRPVQTYFIQAATGGPIKIGHSVNPVHRLRSLQTSNDTTLEILAVLEADRENELQTTFRELRERGEWYRCEKPLVDFLIANVSLSKAHQARLIEEVQKPFSLSAPEGRNEPPCDVVLDREHLGGLDFANALTVFMLDNEPDCDCDGGFEGDYVDRHHDNCCPWGVWQSAETTFYVNADRIDRLGIDVVNQVLWLVTRDLNTPLKKQFLKEDLAELAFELDCASWGLGIVAFDFRVSSEPRVYDGFHLFLESLGPPTRPAFGDPRWIARRDGRIFE